MDAQSQCWTVVAAGPSLNEIDPSVVAARSNVVAVNRAFYWLDGRCKAWCVLEQPLKLWNMMGVERTHELVADQELWVPKNKFLRTWKREFPDGNRVAFGRPARTVDNKRCTSPGWDTTLLWSNGTTLTALALSCARGATQIDLIGCDQTGRGGYGYVERKNPHPWWKKRWELERTALERSVAEAAEHGVTITRLSPQDIR